MMFGCHIVATGLQDGVGVQVEGEVERMAELLLSHSVYLGGMSRAQSQCVTTELPLSLFFLSLSLSISLITHFLVQTGCLPGIKLVSSAAHEAAVISVETGSISFTASSITSITCAITSAHFTDDFCSVSGQLDAASVSWLEVGTSAETVT